jgi:hypothetical protein
MLSRRIAFSKLLPLCALIATLAIFHSSAFAVSAINQNFVTAVAPDGVAVDANYIYWASFSGGKRTVSGLGFLNLGNL